MNRLRYPAKLSLAGLLFLVPLTLVTVWLLRVFQGQIGQMEQERTGVKYEAALQRFLLSVAHNEDDYVRQIGGFSRAHASPPWVSQEIKAFTATTEPLDRELGISSRGPQAMAAANALQTISTENPQQGKRLYVDAVRSLMSLQSEVSNNSKLVLDSNYDTYYLVAAATIDAPALLRSASEAEALWTANPADALSGGHTGMGIAIILGQVVDSCAAVTEDVSLITKYNRTLGGSLQGELTDLRDAESDFVASESSLERSGSNDRATQMRRLDAIQRLSTSANRFTEYGLALLDNTIARQIQDRQTWQDGILATDALFLLLAAYAFVGLYGSVTRTVKDLASAGAQVRAHCESVRSVAAGGDFLTPQSASEPIRVETRDELRELGQTIIDLSSDLRSSVGDYVRARQELMVAKNVAEQANRAKTEFLSRMSHELRTPLNSIMGFAQVLEAQNPRDEQVPSVRLIYRSGRHLLELIEEIIDLSRIETGDLSMSLEPVLILPLIREALSLAAPLAQQKSVSFTQGPVESPELCVRADRKRLTQVCLNLISNAIKYNVEGGAVRWTVSQSGDRVTTEFLDTGVGIDPNEVPKLFSPFARLGREASAYEGTGLGLALSKRLIEAAGGTFSYRPNEPAGSIFSFELDAAVPPSELEDLNPLSAKIETRSWGATKRILLVEDNVVNVEFVRKVLDFRPEARLVVAMRGGLGVELAKQKRPDLILLDLDLPDISGLQVMQQLREDADLATIPVVVITADATQTTRNEVRKSQAVEHLTRPVDVSKYLSVIDSICEGGPVAR